MWFSSFLLTHLWFFVLLAAFGLPYAAVRLARWQQYRRFYNARYTELANPLDAQARYQMGHLFLRQRRYRKALPYLEEAYRLQQSRPPLNPRLLDDLARAYFALGRQEEALSLLKESLSLDPQGNQGEAFLLLAALFRAKGDLARERDCLLEAHKHNTSLAEPIFHLAALDAQEGRREEAKRRLDGFLREASHLPAFVRKRNRLWALKMRIALWIGVFWR
jgi:tetratricopeptide (TPR) repeat protein